MWGEAKDVPPCRIVVLHLLMLEELKCGVNEVAKTVSQKDSLKENPENASRVRAREERVQKM